MAVEVILLSDNNNGGNFGSSRPAAAYVLSSQLEMAGVTTQVIEYFTQHADPLSLIRPFITDKLLLVGFCSTFISAPGSTRSRLVRSDNLNDFYKGELWFQRGDDLKLWLERLRTEVSNSSPNCKFLVGGVKAQFAIWRNQYYEEIDYVCLGPGDIAIVDLVKKLREGSAPDCRDFHGVKVLNNKSDIDRTDCPRNVWTPRHLIQKNESLPLEVARGCLYNCKFCHHDKMESLRKSAKDLKEELIRNFELFGTDTYYLTDDCINDHRSKVELFYNVISSLPFKIEWVGFARVDVGIRFPETMKLLMDSGARGLYFGIESFNRTASLKAGKGTPPEKVKEFLIEMHEQYSDECLLAGSFIVGLPGETPESQVETNQWLFDNPVFDFVNIGPLGLMPYVAHFDKLNIDYADYSRNPRKYGFTKVDYENSSWEHETFNSVTAYKYAEKFKAKWLELKGPRLFNSIWFYTHLKALGFSKNQIFAMVRGPESLIDSHEINIAREFEQLKERYFSSLKGLTRELRNEHSIKFEIQTHS